MKNFFNSPIGRLRIIGITEGISSLVLFFIAMPLKYFADMPLAVKYSGWVHGVLFMIYILAAAQVFFLHRWSFGKGVLAVLASIVPVAPFVFDAKVLKPEHEELLQKKPLAVAK